VKLVRIKAIARKETLQIARDPLSLIMAFLVPLFLLLIFGYAITFDIREIDMVIVDQDRSIESRDLARAFEASGYFTITAVLDRVDAIDDELDSGRAKVAVLVPRDFSRKLRIRRTAELGVVLDGSDANTATIAQGYLTGIVRQYATRLVPSAPEAAVEVRTRVWYNAELKSRNFIIPGLIAVIMSVIVALLTSLTVSREWERGTMEQLIATPVRTPELIIGKLIPYFVIGFVDTVLCVVMGTMLFEVPLRGSVTLLLLLSGLFLAGGLCMGILISIVSRNQLLSSQMALLSTFLPSFLLSGFIFAIPNMPEPLQLVTFAVPARYFVTILKGIFLKGSTFGILMPETLLLTVFGALLFLLANRKFRKRVE
jgi:ABC-2 type transport system permease protein